MEFIRTNKKRIGAFFAALICLRLSKAYLDKIRANRLQKKALAHIALKNSKKIEIPEISQERLKFILSLKAYELIESFKAKKLSVSEVLYVYISRSQTLGRQLNLTAEELFEAAISQLSDLPLGPLHGVPMSIKDEFFTFGSHTSGGLIRFISRPDLTESTLVALLKDSGAIPFVKGNVMQMSYWYETINNIYGRAENPWDRLRTTGGSSGGDAGLVASRSTVIGVGSDLGGSIRIPSAFCGVYGFKPSSLRTSQLNKANTHSTATSQLEILIKPSNGPIGSCVEDLVLVLEAWWKEKLWRSDNLVVPMPFNREKYLSKKPMRVGVYDYNGIFKCSQVVKTAVQAAAQRMQELGHEVVNFNTDLMKKGADLFVRSIFGIKSRVLIEKLEGEALCWPYVNDYLSYKCPIYGLYSKLMLKLSGHKQVYEYVQRSAGMTLKKFCELHQEILQFKEEFNIYWRSLDIDALICPIWPLVAPYHETTMGLIPAFSYSFITPAGVLPVGTVKAGDDFYDSDIKDASVKVAQQTMKNSVGMPYSVQVVSISFEDESVLRVMKDLQDYFQFFEKPDLDSL